MNFEIGRVYKFKMGDDLDFIFLTFVKKKNDVYYFSDQFHDIIELEKHDSNFVGNSETFHLFEYFDKVKNFKDYLKELNL